MDSSYTDVRFANSPIEYVARPVNVESASALPVDHRMRGPGLGPLVIGLVKFRLVDADRLKIRRPLSSICFNKSERELAMLYGPGLQPAG